ncbi:hypothetical protein [Swinepox virus]|uniref:Uncharacterized protein n=1 Tax=Swinepox virus TaxID=10276 RepID=A0A881SYA5_SWPV|nr:hypothetical protein [Swinepox virus]
MFIFIFIFLYSYDDKIFGKFFFICENCLSKIIGLTSLFMTCSSAESKHIRCSPSLNTESSIIKTLRLPAIEDLIILIDFNKSFFEPTIDIERNIFSISESDTLQQQKCVILVLPLTGTCLYV